MAIANLQAIIEKVRKLTLSANSNQLPDSEIIDKLNSFYIYDFPAQFRALDLKDRYTFNTIKGIDTYPFNRDEWMTVQGPATIGKREAYLFMDDSIFFTQDFNSGSPDQNDETAATGDGTTGPYSFTLQDSPILRSVNNNPAVDTPTSNTSVFPEDFPPDFNDNNIGRNQNFLITANVANGNTENVTDDGAGNLIDAAGTASGTVNYTTGAISVTFSEAIPSGEDIIVRYRPLNLEEPISILFFQNQFTLRPVPDAGYTVQMVGYRLPSSALLGTTSNTTFDLDGRPEQLEWWETLAIGTAKKVYEDRLDAEGIALMDKMLQERYALNETRTYASLSKRRAPTIFQTQLDYQNNLDPSYFRKDI